MHISQFNREMQSIRNAMHTSVRVTPRLPAEFAYSETKYDKSPETAEADDEILDYLETHTTATYSKMKDIISKEIAVIASNKDTLIRNGGASSSKALDEFFTSLLDTKESMKTQFSLWVDETINTYQRIATDYPKLTGRISQIVNKWSDILSKIASNIGDVLTSIYEKISKIIEGVVYIWDLMQPTLSVLATIFFPAQNNFSNTSEYYYGTRQIT